MRGVVLAGLVLALACSSSRGAGPGGNRNVITSDEIRALNVSTAMDVVQRLRPEFLRGRGRASIQDPAAQFPVVYVDGVRAGGIDALRTIGATDVLEIRYINSTDATTRYGTGHTGGVIEVRIRS